MAAANSDLSEDRRIVLRIGANLGDVIIEGSDLYGEGINIASRLKALAEPGGILLSGTTYDRVPASTFSAFILGPLGLT